MARRSFRNFIADFRTLGIEYLPHKGPQVSDDIQMVHVMGDVAAPQPSATFGGQAPRTPIAALRGAAELFTGQATGFLVWWGDNASNFNAFSIGRVALITANILTHAGRQIAAGDLEQSLAGSRFRLRSGTVPAAAPIGVGTRSNTENPANGPIFLPQGTFVTIVDFTVNDDQNVGFIWTELP